MNALIKAMVVSLLPVSELRGGIPIAIFAGINVFLAYFLCVFANILIIPIVFFFLDYINKYFMKLGFYRRLFNSHIKRSKGRIEKSRYFNFKFLALMLFVAVPLPVTGAYTATLLAWFFKKKKKKSFLFISLGVMIAGIIVSVVSLTGSTIFRFFVK